MAVPEFYEEKQVPQVFKELFLYNDATGKYEKVKHTEVPDLSLITQAIENMQGEIASLQSDIGTLQGGYTDLNSRVEALEGGG